MNVPCYRRLLGMVVGVLPLVAGLCSAPVRAQEAPAEGQEIAPPTGYLRVTTNAPSGRLYININDPPPGRRDADDPPLGPVSDGLWAVPAGRWTVWLVEDDAAQWNPRRVQAEVEVVAAETLTVALALPVRYRIETLPLGATVVYEDPEGGRTVLGTAPLVQDHPAPLEGTFVVSLEGYATQRHVPGTALTNRHTVLLAPLVGVADAEPVGLPGLRPSRRWIDWAAAGVAVAGAAVAVHYKFRANALDDRYRDPQDPRYRDETLLLEAERLDLYSGLGLGGLQLGLGVLAFRLILQ